MKRPAQVVCVGELLWDVMPGQKTLGGAPANVAYHLHRLGVAARVVTRIGNDDLGSAALAEFTRHGIDQQGIQRDERLPTGAAYVKLDAAGNAAYEFVTPAAWDAIEFSPADLGPTVVFGTLGQRDARSRAAIRRLVACGSGALDLNLRAPYVDRDVVYESLGIAGLVKLNEDEVRTVAGWLDSPADPAGFAGALSKRFGVRTVCITRGALGALVVDSGAVYEAAPVPVEVVDTIGAGDAFLAALLLGRLHGSPWADTLALATSLGSLVAGSRGARPDYDGAALRSAIVSDGAARR